MVLFSILILAYFFPTTNWTLLLWSHTAQVFAASLQIFANTLARFSLWVWPFLWNNFNSARSTLQLEFSLLRIFSVVKSPSFHLSANVFISPSFLKGRIDLSWLFLFLSILKLEFHRLLASIDNNEKSAVKLTIDLLEIIFLSDASRLSLPLTFHFTTVCLHVDLFLSTYLEIHCTSCI